LRGRNGNWTNHGDLLHCRRNWNCLDQRCRRRGRDCGIGKHLDQSACRDRRLWCSENSGRCHRWDLASNHCWTRRRYNFWTNHSDLFRCRSNWNCLDQRCRSGGRNHGIGKHLNQSACRDRRLWCSENSGRCHCWDLASNHCWTRRRYKFWTDHGDVLHRRSNWNCLDQRCRSGGRNHGIGKHLDQTACRDRRLWCSENSGRCHRWDLASNHCWTRRRYKFQ